MSHATMNHAHMMAAASAEAASSCANYTALIMDATLLASILFTVLRILGLRLRSLIRLLGLHTPCRLKAVPTFG